MQKILLYYKFVPLADPETVRLWQRALCEKLDLKGRILIAKHGINGTVGGDIEALKAYVKETKQHPALKGIVFKWSEGERSPGRIMRTLHAVALQCPADDPRLANLNTPELLTRHKGH